MALDLGGLTPILYGFIERDEVVEMLAALTGQRMLFNYFRIGGVNGDLNHEFMSRLGVWMSHAAEQVEANLTLLNENELFVRRMRGVGRLDRETAFRIGVTGPSLRASGIPLDMRRTHPVLRLPGARLRHPDPRRGGLPGSLPDPDRRDPPEPSDHRPVPPRDARRSGDGQAPPAPAAAPGRAFAGVEGPRGINAVYAVSDGTDQPFRMRIHDPSFVNLQLLSLMLPGNLVADMMAVFSSLDPIMGGVDK